MTIDDGVFEVIATNGDTHLGGEDFDQRLMDYFMKVFKKKTGHDMRTDDRAVQKLRREVEKAKRTLSSKHETHIEIESLFDGKDFKEKLTRAKFEELNMVRNSNILKLNRSQKIDFLFGLWFKYQSTAIVMSRRSVNLNTLLLAKLSG